MSGLYLDILPTTKSTPSGFTIGIIYNEYCSNNEEAGYPQIVELLR